MSDDIKPATSPADDPTDNKIIGHNGELTEEAARAIRVQSMLQDIEDAKRKGTYLKPKYAHGRRAVLAALDILLARTNNVQKVYQAMQERLDVDPVGFIKEIVMPLLPKTLIEGRDDLSSATDGGEKTVVVIPDNGRDLVEPKITGPESTESGEIDT